MTRELECDENGAEGVRRIARSQIETASKALAARRPTDSSLHTARKEMKRARASLRALRDALGEERFARENAALRDAARPLTPGRDAKVLRDALETLIERAGRQARGLELAAFRRLLREEHAAARRELFASPGTLAGARRALRAAARRSTSWPLGRGGWGTLGAGLRRQHAKGRKAFAAARAERTAESLHEWRKQTKYLWHQLQLLAPLWPGLIEALADETHKLADRLGDDRDLYMLRQKIRATGRRILDSTARDRLLALIDARRAKLQARAVALGHRLYDEKPKAVEARFAGYWQAWRAASP